MKISEFPRFLKNHFWRITVSVITISIVAIAVFLGIGFYKAYNWENNIQLSENLGFRNNQNGGYVYNLKTNEKVILDVDWVVTPKDNDSIAVFHWKNIS